MTNKYVGAANFLKNLVKGGKPKTTGTEVISAVSPNVPKTTADKAFNYIGTGKPEMPVGGQKRMLPEKKRNSKAY